jgi:hypothetical protein
MLNRKNDEKIVSSPKAFLIRDKLSPRAQITNIHTPLKDSLKETQPRLAPNPSTLKKSGQISMNMTNPSSFLGKSPPSHQSVRRSIQSPRESVGSNYFFSDGNFKMPNLDSDDKASHSKPDLKLLKPPKPRNFDDIDITNE